MSRTFLCPRPIAALSALTLSLGAVGCTTDSKKEPGEQMDGSAGGKDAGPDGHDASEPGADGAAPNTDLDGSTADGGSPDGSTPGDNDAGQDAGPLGDLAPFALDCKNLPSNGVCQGGPHEVLLVMEETGLIAMFEPADGKFLGYFKRPGKQHYVDNDDGYSFATQGPDQCIWTVSDYVPAGVERWNTDGTFRDAPLKAHSLPNPGGAPQPALDSPIGLSFTADRLYVTSSDRITRWKLNGDFDSVVFESDSISAILALGDGSLLYSQISGGNGNHRLMRLAAGGGTGSVVLGKLDWPGQISYAADGQVLVESTNLGSTAYRVNVATGQALTVYPVDGDQKNIEGIAPLTNGKWLIAGGSYYVSVLDPSIDPSTHMPTGLNSQVWVDPAIETTSFKQIGRACVSEAFLASRASKPANDTCIPPPAGAAIFSENFDGSGDFTGSGTDRHYNDFYDHAIPGFTSSLATGPGSNNTRALRLDGAGFLAGDAWTEDQTGKTGIHAKFPESKPKYISYQVYVPSATPQGLGYLLLQNAKTNTGQWDSLAGSHVVDGEVVGENTAASSAPDTFEAKWVKVELRNIDWDARSYDLYVDCKRRGEAIDLPEGFGDTMDLMDLFNYADTPDLRTVSWFDDILIK